MPSNPKKHVSLIFFSTVLSAFSLASILNFTDPFSSSWTTFAFFYISLFLVSVGSFTLLGLALRYFFAQGLFLVNLGISFRQGLLLALLIVTSFFLLSQGLLYWWVEASLILFLASVEALFNLKI